MMGIEANNCPSQFALDDHELHGGGNPAIRRHLEDCARCQGRIVERATNLAAFRESAAPLWTRIAAGAEERRRAGRRWRLFFQLPALVVALGAAALVLKARSADAPAVPYVGPKGGGPVEIVCRRAAATFVLAPGDDVAPGDELRFRPRPVRPDARFIQIGSVDGTGRYTPFYPAAAGAASVPLPERGQALEGSIRLDAAPGPERLFIVLSAAPLPETAVRRAAEPRAAAGVAVDEIDGAAVSTAWIVLQKRREAATAP
jgi:hypothetical protein